MTNLIVTIRKIVNTSNHVKIGTVCVGNGSCGDRTGGPGEWPETIFSDSSRHASENEHHRATHKLELLLERHTQSGEKQELI